MGFESIFNMPSKAVRARRSNPAQGTCNISRCVHRARKCVHTSAFYIKDKNEEERERVSSRWTRENRRDACRARLVARITVVDAYISIASSTSRRSNSALSVHPPHPTAAPWVAAIHSALLYRSLRSSRDVTGDVNAPGEEDARAICVWLVISLACVTRETARPVDVVDEFSGWQHATLHVPRL